MLPINVHKHFLHLYIFLQACADAYAQRQESNYSWKRLFLKSLLSTMNSEIFKEKDQIG